MSVRLHYHGRAAPCVEGQQDDEQHRTDQFGEDAQVVDLGQQTDADGVEERGRGDQEETEQHGIEGPVGFVGGVADHLKTRRDVWQGDLQGQGDGVMEMMRLAR